MNYLKSRGARVAALVLAVAPVAAMAQTSTGSTGGSTMPDFGAAITGAQTQITSLITTNGVALIGLVVVPLGLALVARWVKRAMKSA